MTAKPLYREIADRYAALIKAGELKAGDYLPTQVQLMEEFDCSISPVRMALKELEIAGLVIIRQGKGTQVKAQE